MDEVLSGLDLMSRCYGGPAKETALRAATIIRAQAERIGSLERDEADLARRLSASETRKMLLIQELEALKRALAGMEIAHKALVDKNEELGRQLDHALEQLDTARTENELLSMGLKAVERRAEQCIRPQGGDPQIDVAGRLYDSRLDSISGRVSELEKFVDKIAADHHNADPGSPLTRWLRNRVA